MLEYFKANFPSKYQKKSLRCTDCKEDKEDETETDEPKDTQQHNLTNCPAYQLLRLQHDLNTDIRIVNYFKAVIQRRTEETIL